MPLWITAVVSIIVSTIITEIRCRMHFDSIDRMVERTLQRMKETCDACVEKIEKRFKN